MLFGAVCHNEEATQKVKPIPYCAHMWEILPSTTTTNTNNNNKNKNENERRPTTMNGQWEICRLNGSLLINVELPFRRRNKWGSNQDAHKHYIYQYSEMEDRKHTHTHTCIACYNIETWIWNILAFAIIGHNGIVSNNILLCGIAVMTTAVSNIDSASLPQNKIFW